jgi:hypothetical protein
VILTGLAVPLARGRSSGKKSGSATLFVELRDAIDRYWTLLTAEHSRSRQAAMVIHLILRPW